MSVKISHSFTGYWFLTRSEGEGSHTYTVPTERVINALINLVGEDAVYDEVARQLDHEDEEEDES